jgi:hypothetical protein
MHVWLATLNLDSQRNVVSPDRVVETVGATIFLQLEPGRMARCFSSANAWLMPRTDRACPDVRACPAGGVTCQPLAISAQAHIAPGCHGP